LATEVLREHLDIRGPSLRLELEQSTGLSPALVEVACAALEAQGFLVRGHFDPGIVEEQLVSRRLLARIHHYTVERLRREIEPVNARDFMRFLLRWQRVVPDIRYEGRLGVLGVIEQLQGFELAVGAWEPQVLVARVKEYRPEWLDALCASGAIVWGRLSPRAANADLRSGSTLSRATPVTLATRADLPWLLQAARAEQKLPDPMQDNLLRVLTALRQQGALFASELAQASGLLPVQIEEALWALVAQGSVTSDSFHSVRSLLSPRTRWASQVHPRWGLRRGAARGITGEGRWTLLPAAGALTDPEALAEAVAEQMLARWGVVLRELVQREPLAIPFRDLLWALRRLEARGTVRGGRFVAGFVGEQYALPEAVDLLRKVRRTELAGEVVRLWACDPLNLIGTIVPGVRVPAIRTNFIAYRDGLPEPVQQHGPIARAAS
jgi:ATP-dependent Lhr-like helicase